MEMGTNSGGAAHQVNSRWNPTKEQISMLESMYRQGIRTPTADQIQQITSRLKDFGNIEGKNVFYWFQNHKARQRQKQKQENLAYISRYLHNKSHQPMFAPPPPNAVSGSYYLPQSELGFYPQYPDVLLPSDGLKRRQRTDQKTEKATTYAFTGNRSSLPLNCNSVVVQTNCMNQETLPLFPLHPTGNLQEKEVTVFPLGSNNSTEESINTTTPSSSSETTIGVDEASTDKPFFDFFSGQVPFETT